MPPATRATGKITVVMGVCGCGKTTFGRALATQLDAEFIEGDKLHPPANIEKMSRGIPLQDEDRVPWLKSIVAEADARAQAGRPVVVACSALKKDYRDLLRSSRYTVEFIHLAGPKEMVLSRVGSRPDHFMPASLVESQYATLESTRDEADVVDLDLGNPLALNLEQYLDRKTQS